jgi:hypothetical protein
MHPGDLIYVSVRPQSGLGVAVRPQCGRGVSMRPQFVSRVGLRPTGGPASPQLAAEPGSMRMALVMVRAGENGAPSVRLVQDFGCPDDPDAPLAAAPPPRRRQRCKKRGRGRCGGAGRGRRRQRRRIRARLA